MSDDTPWFLLPQKAVAQVKAAIAAATPPPVKTQTENYGGTSLSTLAQWVQSGTTKTKTAAVLTPKAGAPTSGGPAPADDSIPVVPIAIGMVALAGVAFVVLRKKKGR